MLDLIQMSPRFKIKLRIILNEENSNMKSENLNQIK